MANDYDDSAVEAEVVLEDAGPSTEEIDAPIVGGYKIGVPDIDFGNEASEESEDSATEGPINLEEYQEDDGDARRKRIAPVSEEEGGAAPTAGLKDEWLEKRNADDSSDWAYDDAA